MDTVSDQVASASPAEPNSAAHELSLYQKIIAGRGAIIVLQFAFGVIASAILTLGGHPRLAIAMTVAASLIAMAVGVATARARHQLTASQVEKNRLIETLTAARDEAMRQAGEAEAAREEARRASLAKSTFLATMSHEIRTPMNGVLGMAQLLQRSDLSGLQRNQVDTLIRSGELLMVILNDILDLSKIDAGQMEIAKAPCDLRVLVGEMETFWSPTAAERGLTLAVEVDPAVPPFVLLDPRRIRQVLFNLVGNALKFTREGAVTITVDLDRATGDLRFAVSDTGVGIAAEDLPHLFQKFSQGDASDVRRFAGVGLGLAICKELSALMGGTVSVESQLGLGSTFRVAVPLEETAAPAAEDIAAQAISEDEVPTLSILCADDNPTNLLVLEQLLGAMGFRIRKANGGREALEAMTHETFDLVLMDIQMPEMTGIDVLQALRAQAGPNRETPLIAVTADAMTMGADRYLDLGFAGFVTKPVQVQSLVSAMMAAVANADEDEVAASA